VVSGVRPIRLVAKSDGGVRTARPVEDSDRPQLTLIRGYKDELASIVEAFGEVEILIRPAASQPELPRWPGLTEAQKSKRRKWLGRKEARFGSVNSELRREPLRPIRKALSKPLRPVPVDEKNVAPNPCAHCSEHCLPSDLTSWLRSDGSWVHLDCELRAAP
jgi:hypothetical protein